MLDVIVEYCHLATTDACADVAHAVVIADGLVLVMEGIFAGLSG